MRFGYVARFARDQTGDGRVLFILEIDTDKPFDLIDLGRAEDVPITVFALDDLDYLLVAGVLVLDLANDLLENVLDSDKPGDAAIFIYHDRDLNMIQLKTLEQF